MSPKRLDRAAPPPARGEWEVRFGTSEAAKGWDDLCAQVPEKTREAFEMVRAGASPAPAIRRRRNAAQGGGEPTFDYCKAPLRRGVMKYISIIAPSLDPL